MALKANSQIPFFEQCELSIFLKCFPSCRTHKKVTTAAKQYSIKANLIYHPDATSLALVRTGQNIRCFGISVEIINLYTKECHHPGPQLCLLLLEYFLMIT